MFVSINTTRNNEWPKVLKIEISRVLITKNYNLETYGLPWITNLTSSDSIYQGRIKVLWDLKVTQFL